MPQRKAEPLISKRSDHASWVREPIPAERQVVDPRRFEPIGVDVDDIAGDGLFAKSTGDLLDLCL